MSRVDASLRAWQQSRDKDKLSHYESAEFRKQYELHEMPKRIKDALKWLSKPVGRLLQQRPTETHIQLLSLGCGPGSDLLAGVKSLLNQGLSSSSKISCTGVDLVPWDQTSFHRQLDVLRGTGPTARTIEPILPQEDSRTFVQHKILQKDLLLVKPEFDLIILNYANAKETLKGEIAQSLTKILRPGGSIVIIDNNTAELRRLMQASPGYKTVYRSKCNNNKNKQQACKTKNKTATPVGKQNLRHRNKLVIVYQK